MPINAFQGASYDLIQEYVSNYNVQQQYDEISTSPHWVLVVVRLGVPLSFNRVTMKSVDTDRSNGAKQRQPNLIITSDCRSLTIINTKSEPIKTLNATLTFSDINYLVEILPGDWILGWIVNNETDFTQLLTKIQSNTPNNPCNKPEDGFKFIGRVQSVRSSMNLNRESGLKTVEYSLQANGFRELYTMFFYDYNLAEESIVRNNLGDFIGKMGLESNSIFVDAIISGIFSDNVNVLIPALLDVILGAGSKNTINNTDVTALHPAPVTQASDEAPFSYLVPASVGAFMGKQAGAASKNSRLLSYSDTLDLISGVQDYTVSSNATGYKIFAPEIKSDSTKNRKVCTKKMLGSFQPNVTDFVNKPVWSVFQQYLNPTLNEIYTCLRVNEDNLVVPTLVFRQLPLTTETFPDSPLGQQIDYTRFLSLPRWKLRSVMVNNVDIGRSDATRFNFIHIYGQNNVTKGNMGIPQQIANNPPIIDNIDIYRSGIRTYMATIACSIPQQQAKEPSKWINLVADWSIGSQWTLNGTITSVGISSPICEGDNLEWDGVVYHIESVTHQCTIDPGSGNKIFNTTLALTNGMRSDPGQLVATKTNNLFKTPIYPGFEITDNSLFSPGLSLEDKFNRNVPETNSSDLSIDDQGKPLTNQDNLPKNIG